MDNTKGFMYLVILAGIGAIALLFAVKYLDFKGLQKEKTETTVKENTVKKIEMPPPKSPSSGN